MIPWWSQVRSQLLPRCFLFGSEIILFNLIGVNALTDKQITVLWKLVLAALSVIKTGLFRGRKEKTLKDSEETIELSSFFPSLRKFFSNLPLSLNRRNEKKPFQVFGKFRRNFCSHRSIIASLHRSSISLTARNTFSRRKRRRRRRRRRRFRRRHSWHTTTSSCSNSWQVQRGAVLVKTYSGNVYCSSKFVKNPSKIRPHIRALYCPFGCTLK